VTRTLLAHWELQEKPRAETQSEESTRPMWVGRCSAPKAESCVTMRGCKPWLTTLE